MEFCGLEQKFCPKHRCCRWGCDSSLTVKCGTQNITKKRCMPFLVRESILIFGVTVEGLPQIQELLRNLDLKKCSWSNPCKDFLVNSWISCMMLGRLFFEIVEKTRFKTAKAEPNQRVSKPEKLYKPRKDDSTFTVSLTLIEMILSDRIVSHQSRDDTRKLNFHPRFGSQKE